MEPASEAPPADAAPANVADLPNAGNRAPASGSTPLAEDTDAPLLALPVDVLGLLVATLPLPSLLLLGSTCRALRRLVFLQGFETAAHGAWRTIDFAGAQTPGVPVSRGSMRSAGGACPTIVFDATVVSLFRNLAPAALDSVRTVRLDWTGISRRGLHTALAACGNRNLEHLSAVGCKGVAWASLDDLVEWARPWMLGVGRSGSSDAEEGPSSAAGRASGPASDAFSVWDPRDAEPRSDGTGPPSRAPSPAPSDADDDDPWHFRLLRPAPLLPLHPARRLLTLCISGCTADAYPLDYPDALPGGFLAPFLLPCCGRRCGPDWGGRPHTPLPPWAARREDAARLVKAMCTRCAFVGPACGNQAPRTSDPAWTSCGLRCATHGCPGYLCHVCGRSFGGEHGREEAVWRVWREAGWARCPRDGEAYCPRCAAHNGCGYEEVPVEGKGKRRRVEDWERVLQPDEGQPAAQGQEEEGAQPEAPAQDATVQDDAALDVAGQGEAQQAPAPFDGGPGPADLLPVGPPRPGAYAGWKPVCRCRRWCSR